MRRELRFLSDASVHVVDDSKKEAKANLQNVSLNGLAIKSFGYLDIEPNSSYQISIIPEKETNIEKIQLETKSRWIKIDKTKMESGFSIIEPLGKTEFEDYLELLAMRGKVAAFPDEEEKA